MKIKNSIIILLSVFCINSFSTEITDRNLAIEYLKLSKMEEFVNTRMKQMEEKIYEHVKPEEKEKVHQIMVSLMGWDAIKDQMVDITVKTYTKEELEALNNFMKTPVGASASDKSEEFSKKYSALTSANLEKVLEKCCAKK